MLARGAFGGKFSEGKKETADFFPKKKKKIIKARS